MFSVAFIECLVQAELSVGVDAAVYGLPGRPEHGTPLPSMFSLKYSLR